MKESLLERSVRRSDSASRLAPIGALAEAAEVGSDRQHRQHRQEPFGLQS
ncbi:hypothetical protein KZO25_11950 [Halomonas sp. ANAO-440]|nr:hypothetical protein [Halomonas sp. ANAO-440]MBZ0331028.1 hypothetical protein [Halomonas sp. ANAO-440]